MAVVSVAVMAHPSRTAQVNELLSALDQSADVVWDRRDNEWDTGRRALLAADPGATHHLIVQDDALVCRDLVASATRAADVAGGRPVSFYTGQVRPHPEIVSSGWRAATAAGATWLQMPGPWWGVALMLPVNHVNELVKFADKRLQHVTDYDRRIARWYSNQSIGCWYSVPSLVDHRSEADSPSLIAGHSIDRSAHGFIGQDASGLSVNWKSTAHAAPGRRLYIVK